jgi:hypothetical protein
LQKHHDEEYSGTLAASFGHRSGCVSLISEISASKTLAANPGMSLCGLAQLRGFALDFAESKKLLPYESMPGLWITTEIRL